MYTGITGSLWIEHTYENIARFVKVGYVSGWNVEESTEVIEKRKVGQAYKEAYPAYQSWSAGAEGVVMFEKNIECAEGESELNGYQMLFNAKHNGNAVKLLLFLNDEVTVSGGKNTVFVGDGYIESLSVDLSAEGAANISISIKGSGLLDIFIDNISPKTGRALGYSNHPLFSLNISEDGHLWINPDANSPYSFDINDGRLTVSQNRIGPMEEN